jgi:hypothetical protein
MPWQPTVGEPRVKTVSENLFESFLTANGIPLRPIDTGPERTPDYEITIGGKSVIVEVKELSESSADFSATSSTRTVGEHIRKRISRASGQLSAASQQGTATILLIFNNLDRLQLYGTEDHDFASAMHGEHTVVIRAGRVAGAFHGHNKALQKSKNTSFSAIGRLRQEHDGSLSVTLFENVHARVPLDYGALPACFEVIRFAPSKNERPPTGDAA